MARLKRHQLVRLTPAGWAGVQQSHAGPHRAAQACLAHWATHDLPLVVTRQDSAPPGQVALGLAAPLRWDRLRLAVQVPRAALRVAEPFPAVSELTEALPASRRPAWVGLCQALAALGVVARVHGSHGWQLITGERCVRDASDLDLSLQVERTDQAEAAVSLLDQAWPGPDAPRLDGELTDPAGNAVAWREWLAWRRGGVTELLVKNLEGVALRPGPQALVLA